MGHFGHLVAGLGVGDDEGAVGVRIKGRQHEHETGTAGAHVGNGAGNLRVDALIGEPARQTLHHFLGGVDTVTRRQVNVDQELVTVAVAKHFPHQLGSNVTAAGEHREGGDQHHVTLVKQPAQHRAVHDIDLAGVRVVVGLAARVCFRVDLHEPEAHERCHVHGQKPGAQQQDGYHHRQREGILAYVSGEQQDRYEGQDRGQGGREQGDRQRPRRVETGRAPFFTAFKPVTDVLRGNDAVVDQHA